MKLNALRVALLCLSLSISSWAQATRTWEQTKFDDFEKGTAHGVAISSDGNLTLAPSFDALYTSPSTYLWSLASDPQGNVYAAAGSPARVYKFTPEGKASIIFAPQELQVQALVVDKNGVLYAATNPDGKVYRIEHIAGTAVVKGKSETDKAKSASEFSASVFFDPGTKYIWDLAFDNSGNLFVATGDHGEIFRVTPRGEHSVFFKSDEAHIRVISGNIDAHGDTDSEREVDVRESAINDGVGIGRVCKQHDHRHDANSAIVGAYAPNEW